jgi:4-hydroxy-tetrahydrodipicolinate synthase
MEENMLKGSIVALVTPFKNGEIDFEAIDKLVKMQIDGGTDGILINGTTGESPTLSDDEALSILKYVKKLVDGKIPVIFGSGSNSTAHSIEKSIKGETAGADALLVVTPYYNKPSQEGIYRHFKAVANSVKIPIILYTVPGRSGANIEPVTVFRLMEVENIVAVKEASGNLNQMMEIKKLCGDGMILFSGDDGLNLPIFAIGGEGSISVTANIAPALVKKVYTAYKSGDMKTALETHMSLFKINRDLFIDANPIPVKTALFLMDKIDLEFRAPLCEMIPNSLTKLKKTLKDLELI